MTGLGYTYKNLADFYGKSDELAFIGSKRIQVADPDNASVNDTGVEGWFDLGYVSAFTAARSIEVADIELPIIVSHPSYQALTLNMGNEIAPIFTAPADGQDTVASSTNSTTTVLTTGTNIAAGDLCKVVTGDTSTYGGYEELVYIRSFTASSKTAVHSELSQTPQAAATFLKVGGAGTVSTGAGIKFTFGGASLPRRKLRIITYLHPAEGMFIDTFTECRLSGVTELEFPENAPMTCGFSFKPLDCGSSVGPLFGYRYYKAYES